MNVFLPAAKQVAILLLLCAVGFVCNKTKLLNDAACKCISNFVITTVTPCVIVRSFSREFDNGLLGNLLITAAASLVIHGVMIAAAHLLIRGGGEERLRVYRFAAVFSNCAFMAIPLQQALLGDIGVFYGSAYIAVFNILLWTYGAVEISGGKSGVSPKKLLINPGVIGVVAGLALFFSPVKLPSVLSDSVGYIAALNTPLPMIVVGYRLAEAKISRVLRDGRAYLCVALRLVILPLLALGLLYAAGIGGAMLSACVIAACAPVGATTVMFASRYGADVELSSDLVSLSTLLSLVTVPLVVSLCRAAA